MAKPNQAYRIYEGDSGYKGRVETLDMPPTDQGDVLIEIAYSSVNYKDALAGSGKGKILRKAPLTGGIDLAGSVLQSASRRFRKGDQVLMTGCGLSETENGGFSQFQRVASKNLIHMPKGLNTREAMILGTAGFTAALCLHQMEQNGQVPAMGPIVVTGATGGVGMLALNILACRGYEVHAISGKTEKFGLLKKLGASQCIDRRRLEWGTRALETASWAGAIDNVGGATLSALTRLIKPWGNIASCGMVAGVKLETTVMPFIIRGINLLGINSAACPLSLRKKIWLRLATTWKPPMLDSIHTQTIGLSDLDHIFERLLRGESSGRTLVRLGND